MIVFLLSCLVIVPCNAVVFDIDSCHQNCDKYISECKKDGGVQDKGVCYTVHQTCMQVCASREENEQTRQRDIEVERQNFKTLTLEWTKLIVTVAGSAIVLPMVAYWFPAFYRLLQGKK